MKSIFKNACLYVLAIAIIFFVGYLIHIPISKSYDEGYMDGQEEGYENGYADGKDDEETMLKNYYAGYCQALEDFNVPEEYWDVPGAYKP